MASIRPATVADAAAIEAIYSPIVRDTYISFETVPPTVDETAAKIVDTTQTHPYLVAVDADDNVTGFAYASKYRARIAYRWSVDVAIYVSPDQHRRGIGKALVSTVLEMLAAQGFYQAFAVIALPNAGSVRLHESQGFRPIGVSTRVGFKLDAWHDVGMWQKALRQSDGEPEELIPFLQFADTERARSILQRGSLAIKP